MGKKKSSETQTSTSAPPEWAVPIIKDSANAIYNNYTANQPGLNALQGQLTGSIIPGLQAQIGKTATQLQPGMDFLGGTMSGKYLNSNPYTTNMAKMAGQDALNSVNSTFSQAGRTGSFDNKAAAAQGVSQAENAVMFQNYQNERGLQNQAAGMMPGYTAAQYQGYTPLLGATQLAGQLPYMGANSLGNIGSILGGYGTQTSSGTKPGGWGTDIVSAGMAALPFIMGSDRRLKDNIVKIGTATDGLGIYEYEYAGMGTRRVGVMADEVRELRPQAYVPNAFGPFDGVDYSKLGEAA